MQKFHVASPFLLDFACRLHISKIRFAKSASRAPPPCKTIYGEETIIGDLFKEEEDEEVGEEEETIIGDFIFFYCLFLVISYIIFFLVKSISVLLFFFLSSL